MRKLFSLLTAILFAGSMMAVDFTLSSAESVTKDGVTVAFDKGSGSSAPAWYSAGLRLYASNTVTLTSTTPMTEITFNWEKQGSKAFNTATASEGSYTHPSAAGEGKWTGSATTVTFTLGASGQLQLNTFSVTLDGGTVTPPVEMTDAEKLEAYIALLGDVKTYVAQFAGLGVGAEDFATQVDQLIAYGNLALSGGDAAISAALAQTESEISTYVNTLLTTGKEGLAKQLDNLLDNAQGCEACVTIVNTLKQTVEGLAWDSNKSNEENLANLVNQTEQILKDAQEQIEAALNPGTTTDPTNCAEAAAAALSVSANNELYNNGAEYTIVGYVTGIKTAYNDTYHNISFWMADTKDGGEVLQAYRAACASEADAPGVGDKVKVTGKLTKYNTTPEFAAACTFEIVEKATGGDTPGGGDTPTVTDPTNCAEAAAAALSVSQNNEEYNGGKEYTIQGYVTGIKTAYSDTYHNISFWMADTKDGGEVLQAYRAACASEEEAPGVGDKVEVTGKLTKYNTTPEFAAGCTFTIIEKAAVEPTFDYYLVGSFNNWEYSADYKLTANAAAAGEYMITLDIPANSTMKVQGISETEDPVWYPDGVGNDFSINDAGKYTIYFRPDGQGGQDWYYGYIYAAPYVAPVINTYDVAELIAAAPAKDTEVYVRGVVSKIRLKGKNFANYGSACIYVTDVNGEEGEVEFFNCFSLAEAKFESSAPAYDDQSTSWAEFTSVTDANGNVVAVGDTVVAFGKYELFNTTHELQQGCYLTEIYSAPVAEWEPWDFVKTQYVVYETDGYIDINLFTNDSYYIEIDDEGSQDLYGEGDCTILTLDLAYTDLNDLTGVYNSDDLSLDLEYTAAVTFVGEETEGTELDFTSGSVSIAWNSDKSGYVLIYNLTDTYGRFCTDTLDIPLYGDTPTPSGDNVQIIVDDTSWYEDEDGYWLIGGYSSDSYYVSLSNLTPVEEIDGVYTAAELDPDYTVIYDPNFNEISIESGSVEVYTEDGSVYVEGTVVGSDGVTYDIYMAYEAVQPTGEEVTITASGDNVVYYDAVSSDGYWIIQGRNEDYTVRLSNYYSISQAAGTYPADELDPDYSWVAHNNDTLLFVSGSITLAEDRGAIILTGDLLDEKGTLYHLNFMYGEPVEPTGLEVTIHAEGDNVEFAGSVSDGYIWLEATDGEYAVSMAVVGIEAVSGTYSASDLYASLSYVAHNQDTVGFASGTFTVEELPKAVLLTGSLLGQDGTLYHLDFIYGDTTAVDPSLGDTIEVTITSGLIWNDQTANAQAGWWQISGSNADYFITLSNAGKVTTAIGTFTADELDKEYSFIYAIPADEEEDVQTITFALGSISIAIDEYGKVIVTGDLVGTDNNTYVLNLQYVEPKAETTVELTIPEGELQDYTAQGIFGISGYSADGTAYGQFIFDGSSVAGTYTKEDLDSYYTSGIWVANASGDFEYVDIYSASFTIVANNDGSYTLTGDVLCYNNTLYKVTLIAPAQEPVDQYEGDTESDFTAIFSTYTVDESRLASMGSVYVIAQNEQGQYIILDVILPGTADGLVAGTYSINNDEEEMTVYAGLFDADENSPIPSYATMVEGQDTNLWYLVEGSVVVDADLNIVVNAQNSKGNQITVTLTAPEDPTGLEETVAAGKAAKILRNGQIYILKGDKIFNIMGAAIR